MTRWARGGSANRKKPLDATEWTEMMSDATSLDADDVSASQKKTRRTKPTASQKFKNKLNCKQKVEVQSNGVRQSVTGELEKLGKESTLAGNLSESVLLEEFVHKDARREARRLKRQEQKRQTRVCALGYGVTTCNT